MATTTVPQPTDTALSVREAMHDIVHADVPGRGPIGIRQNRLNRRILALDFLTIDDLYQWLPFFGYTGRRPEPDVTDDNCRYVLVCVDWRGWRVQMHADEPIETPTVEEQADALLADLAAIPVKVVQIGGAS